MNLLGNSNAVEDMQEPPSSQMGTSIAKITLWGIPVIPFLYIAFICMVNAFLPPDDAPKVKELGDKIFTFLGVSVFGGGPLALFIRSLMLTGGKIKNQTPQPLPETVNAGGDVNLNQSTPQPVSGSFELPVEDLAPDEIEIEEIQAPSK